MSTPMTHAGTALINTSVINMFKLATTFMLPFLAFYAMGTNIRIATPPQTSATTPSP